MALTSEMTSIILEKFGFSPTDDQRNAICALSDFLLSGDSDSAFVLHGFAGTGKTSVVGALVRTLESMQQPTELMAPTGRAAKVFARHAGKRAWTIHRRIYRQRQFTGEMTDFMQGVNLRRGVLFIVDEASMVSNTGSGNAAFGTGCLLDDLVQYVYSGAGCRLLLVGDDAQLPPVGEEASPALERMMLEGYGLHVGEAWLTDVVRQLAGSGILSVATYLRQMLTTGNVNVFPQLPLQGFADIVSLPGNELLEALEDAYSTCGTDETIVVTRSNARANIYNNGIRARVLDMDCELGSGDHVLVVKNNYHWVEAAGEAKADDEPDGMDFIANGDMAIVRRLRNEHEQHGFRFAEATLRFPDYDDTEVEAMILLDTLAAEAPALTRVQQQSLFDHVWADYPELTRKRDRMKAVRNDRYYNALQIKYAYAVTCHKAQGGQWRRVFIDQGYITEDMLSADYYRWLYTAVTRATERVYLIR